MMKAVVSLTVLAGAAAGAYAQTSTLYLTTAFGTNRTYAIQGGSLINSWSQTGSGESGIAVAGDIRTTASSGGTGVKYSLTGTPLGPTYPFSGSGARYDGTTDGIRNNYATPYASGQVYSYDRDWGSESFMFTAGHSILGLTYDTTDGTFWASALDGTSTIYHYNTSGGVIGSFPWQGGGAQFGLALDPADGTLWSADYGSSSPRLSQYSKTGTLLQQFAVSGFNPGSSDVLGMEFDVTSIPAPASLSLVGLGALVAGRRRR